MSTSVETRSQNKYDADAARKTVRHQTGAKPSSLWPKMEGERGGYT